MWAGKGGYGPMQKGMCNGGMFNGGMCNGGMGKGGMMSQFMQGSPYGGCGKGMANGFGMGKGPVNNGKGAKTAGRSDTWTCQCGNVNFGDREVCNMRSCALPRPAPETLMALGGGAPVGGKLNAGWTCGQCGNQNFADREVCNMRSCQAPRPF